jgi:hypothetical protein
MLHPTRTWATRSIAYTLHAAHATLNQLGLNVPPRPSTPAPDSTSRKSDTQMLLYNAIRPRFHPTSLPLLLHTRWQRWITLFGGERNLSLRTRQAPLTIQALHNKLPPCIRASLLCTWLNGWCTARRFQQPRQPCSLSETCDGDDAIEHYAICPAIWQCAHQFLRLQTTPRSLPRFLCVHPLADDNINALAIHVHITLAITRRNHFSHQRCPNQQDLQLRYIERLRTLVLLAPATRRWTYGL